MASQTEQQITQRLDNIFQDYESNSATEAYYQTIAAQLKTKVLEELVAGADFADAIAMAFADEAKIKTVLATITNKKPPVYTYTGDPFFQKNDEAVAKSAASLTNSETGPHEEPQNQPPAEETTEAFATERDLPPQASTGNWKELGQQLLEKMPPLKDELLGLVGAAFGEPLLVHAHLENAASLEDAWWATQEKKNWTPLQYDLPGANVKSVVFDGFTDSNLALFAGTDEDFHIIEQLALDNGDLFSRYQLGGQLRFTEGPRPAVAKGMKSYLTVYFPVNFTGQLQVVNNSGRLLLGGLTDLTTCQLHLKSGALIAREISSQTLTASATSGSLDVAHLSSNSATLTTKSGALRVTDSDSELLKASTTSGSLRLTNGAYHEVVTSAKSGSLKLNQLTAHRLAGHTKSGNLSLKNSQCPAIYGETKSGSLHFQQLQGGGLLKTKSGTIRGTGLSLTQPLEMTTKDGNIAVGFTPEASYHFDLHTINGQVKHLGDYTKKISHGNHLVGSMGSRPLYELLATSKNGNLTIQ